MLEASVLADKKANVNLESRAICIFLERRVPALPLFTLLQHHSTISKRAEIKTNKAIFHVHHFQGRSHQNVDVKPLKAFLNLGKCFSISVVSSSIFNVFQEFSISRAVSLFSC